MGIGLRAVTRRNVIAVAIGTLLAGAPLLAFDFWLNGLIDRQGQEDIDTSAKRAVALAESRVNQVTAALDRPRRAWRGFLPCRQRGNDAARHLRHRADQGSGADWRRWGDALHRSRLAARRAQVLSSEPLFGAKGYTLDIVQVGNGEHMVRLRRKIDAGPRASRRWCRRCCSCRRCPPNGGPFSAKRRDVTRDGHVIGIAGEGSPAPTTWSPAACVRTNTASRSKISIPRASSRWPSHEDFERLGIFAASGVALLLVGVWPY